MFLIRPSRRFAAALVLTSLLLAGCQPEPPPAPVGGAARPTQVVQQLARHLRDNDFVGYVHAAVPPALAAQLETAWRDGGSRWPLTELPFDERLPAMLGALAKPGSEARFQAVFEREFAGAQNDIRTAASSLGLFGAQYLQTEGDFSDHQREHYTQLVMALSQWGSTAPLADSARARQAITRLASSARATGLTSKQAFTDAGMTASLHRLAPFIAALKTSLAAYGLDIDHALAGVRAGLIEQTGDSARVRVQYRLAGQDIDTIIDVERRDGRWYPSQTLSRAEAALAAARAVTTPATSPDPAVPNQGAKPPPATP